MLGRPQHRLVKKLTKASLKEEEWGVLLRIKNRKGKESLPGPLKRSQHKLQRSKAKIRSLRFRKDPSAARAVRSRLARLHNHLAVPHQPSRDRLTTKRLMNIDFPTRRGGWMSPRRKQRMRERKKAWRTQKKAARRNAAPLR